MESAYDRLARSPGDGPSIPHPGDARDELAEILGVRGTGAAKTGVAASGEVLAATEEAGGRY